MEKIEIQSQDVYVILKDASKNFIIEQDLMHKSTIISVDITTKTKKGIHTYNILGYLSKKENKIYILYNSLFYFFVQCVSTKRIISCSLGSDIQENYNKIENNDLEMVKDEILLNSEEENLVTDIKMVERISVCMVVEHNEQIRLYRLADINDQNQIIPFIPDNNLLKVFENRNRLYKKDGPEQIGYIGVWNWTATSNSLGSELDYMKDYIESWYRAEYKLIEVVIISENKPLEFTYDELMNLEFKLHI